MSDRGYRVTVRFDRVEAQRLHRLSRETATTPVEVIRVLIRNIEPAQVAQLFQREQALQPASFNRPSWPRQR